MKPVKIALGLVALALSASPALAGPPGLCQRLELAPALVRELPLSAAPDGWSDVAPGIDGPRAVELTLAALEARSDPFFRMEAMRRCAIVVTGLGPREDPSRAERERDARALLDGLRTRVEGLVADEHAPRAAVARARYDLAYAAGILAQAGLEYTHSSAARSFDVPRTFAEALEGLGDAVEPADRAALELGVALACWTGPRDRSNRAYGHVAKALAGHDALAAGDARDLLAKNLRAAAEHLFDAHDLDALRGALAKEARRG